MVNDWRWSDYWPQGAMLHPVRPWWHRTARIVDPLMPTDYDAWWYRAVGLQGPRASEGDLDALAELDRAHPRSAPPPRVGQVWRGHAIGVGGPYGFEDSLVVAVAVAYRVCDYPKCAVGDATIILRRVDGERQMLVRVDPEPGGWRWPPSGAVLVAGPGAPWAPEELLG